MRYKRSTWGVCLILITLSSLAPVTPTGNIVLDSEGNIGWYNSTVLSGDTLLVSSYNARFFRLRLARCDVANTFCEHPQITTVEDNTDWFASPKINKNVVIISYYEARLRHLNLLTCHIGDTFCADAQIVTLDTNEDVGEYSSLALSGNTVVISYYDAVNADLKIGTCELHDLNCDSFQAVTVDSVGDVGQFSSLVLSGSRAIIAYYDATNFALKMARCGISGSLCEQSQTVTVDRDASVGFGWYAAIALKGNDTAVMSYYDATHGALKLAACSLSDILCEARQIVTVDSGGIVGLYSSVAVYDNRAVISYYDVTNNDLKLAICNISDQLCATHLIVTLDNEGDVGKYTSIALHGTQAIISYQDTTKGHLKLASYPLP